MRNGKSPPPVTKRPIPIPGWRQRKMIIHSRLTSSAPTIIRSNCSRISIKCRSSAQSSSAVFQNPKAAPVSPLASSPSCLNCDQLKWIELIQQHVVCGHGAMGTLLLDRRERSAYSGSPSPERTQMYDLKPGRATICLPLLPEIKMC